jgi:hypothetical protein
MSNWTSKYKYLIKGTLGRITWNERTGVYTLAGHGQIIPVPKVNGDKIKAMENSFKPLPVGRQELFPGVKVKSHPIRLPESAWEEMEKPYSLTIADALRAKGYHV